MRTRPEIAQQVPAATPRADRVIGAYTTGRPGPLVVVTAGIHGNEPAGTVATRRVLEELSARALPLRGKLLCITGNIGALSRGQRFVDRDLNRGWTQERIAALVARDPALDDSEDREQREILALFLGVMAEAKEPVVFLDLHSTSAGGSPFCAIADTLRNRTVSFALPVPVILGLEEMIDGTMLSYLDDLGHIAVVFEGGQNQAPSTIDHHESALWLALEAAGSLSKAEITAFAVHHARLSASSAGIPHVVEVRYRHGITAADQFKMKPGYVNFQRLARGEVLAEDRRGGVTCPDGDRILMPLYQAQGDDGFFAVREIKKFWLHVSAVIRKLRMHVLLPLLPGVSWHRERQDTLLVDSGIARFLVREIFHLFGFRRMRPEGGKLVFSRRRPGFKKLAQARLDLKPNVP